MVVYQVGPFTFNPREFFFPPPKTPSLEKTGAASTGKLCLLRIPPFFELAFGHLHTKYRPELDGPCRDHSEQILARDNGHFHQQEFGTVSKALAAVLPDLFLFKSRI